MKHHKDHKNVENLVTNKTEPYLELLEKVLMLARRLAILQRASSKAIGLLEVLDEVDVLLKEGKK